MNLNYLALHMKDFTEKHFPKHNRDKLGLLCGEEVGEVQRAILKQGLQIRGTYEFWQDELEKEIAEAITALCALAGNVGMDLEGAIETHLKRIETIDFNTPRGPHE